MRYLKLSENQNKGNDIAVNEYGERIAPKPEKSENTARNNASANNRSYSRYQKPFRRPALPPKGVSAAAFGRQQAENANNNNNNVNAEAPEKPHQEYQQQNGYRSYRNKPYNKNYNKNYKAPRQQNDAAVTEIPAQPFTFEKTAFEKSYEQSKPYGRKNQEIKNYNQERRYQPRNNYRDDQQAAPEEKYQHVVYHSNHRAVKRTPLRIIPLGGLNEIGKNMTVFECGNDMFIVDCGLAFPDSDMPGVDLVIPDFTYVEQNIDKVRGIVITHGHEDHIGGLAYLLKKVNIPVYATRLTIGLIEGKLKEHNLLSQTKLNVVTPRQTVKMGCMAVEFIHVNHSIPDAVGLAIHTPAGIVIHTGDFKVDFTPIEGGIIDLARFGELGNRGVLALMSDSTNAEKPGHTASERKVGSSFENLFAKAEGKRIIIATFASNIHRIQQIINNAVRTDRKVAVFGRSMLNVISTAMELGYLSVPEGVIIDLEAMNKYPPEKIVLITTGSQGEPMSALTRMAMNEHRSVTITPMDYIIISATPIPGNEKSVTKIVNGLLLLGAEVIYESMYDVHVSGHACQEEQKLMLTLTRPKYFLPVHGEYKQLKKHALTAASLGIPTSNILIAENGSNVILTKDEIKLGEPVTAGAVMVDGLGVGDVGNVVLRDRKHLSEDGLVIIVATVDSKTGKVLAGPDLVSRGFVYVRENESLMDGAQSIVENALDRCVDEHVRDWNSVKTRVREALSSYIYRRTKRSPMILPILMEV